MAVSVSRRIAALQSAASAERWDEFADAMRAWAEEEPDNPWVQAGLVVAEAAQGNAQADAAERVRLLDARLADQIALLVDLRAGRRSEACGTITRELAFGNREPALMDAYRWVEPGLAEPVKYFFSTPHLVAGCVLSDGQITSMAAKGSRMSADSLGHHSSQMWSDILKLAKRIDIGIPHSAQVVGKDGAWVLTAASDEPSRLVTALVAVGAQAEEAAARAQAISMEPEAAHD